MTRAQGWQLRVRGLVQGVGFRPAVWRLATQAELSGEVLNDAEGVLIRLHCPHNTLKTFIATLRAQAPPLSHIDSIEIADWHAPTPPDSFTITASQSGAVRTGIVPDAATCPDCLADIRDPKNRRFGYAFTNCTNCGPRLSITRAIPYDRANTAMAAFTMCADCQREYDNPADRRFHAQPNACPTCGPQLTLVGRDGAAIPGDALETATALLKTGKILAVKGLGGFQLACDAANAETVNMLRHRKRRPAKPFALMARDLAQVGDHAHLTPTAITALISPDTPIILLPIRPDGGNLAPGIAPGQTRLGIMLPNTPLHHLLLDRLTGPLVMTSGNLASEPQVTDNAQALDRLADIADAWLLHDRDIINRLDDSVVQLTAKGPQTLRRARGLAPAPLQLHRGFANSAPVLATGADLKNTFCLLKDGQAIVSQHMGDMENDRTHRDFRANLVLFSTTHHFTPDTVAIDAHPGYFSSRLGQDIAAETGANLTEVQHHHAHITATLAEHGHAPDTPPVLGIVLDGLGYGDDGTIWGGEFLLADFKTFRRVAHFAPIALPGGDKANQQPWRNTFAHLHAAFGPNALTQLTDRYGPLPLLDTLRQHPLDPLTQMIERGLNAPLASSAGRLFDAVAAALGICFNQISYEGQAAMQLQGLAETAPDETGHYPCEPGAVLHWHGLWQGILSDLAAGQPRQFIAARCHNSLIKAICDTAIGIANSTPIDTITLSGGVFQNTILLDGVDRNLTSHGLTVLSPHSFPANDGGLALGQAVIAAARA